MSSSNFVCLTQPLIDVQIRGVAASSEIQDHDQEDKPAHLSEEALAAIKAEAFDAGIVEVRSGCKMLMRKTKSNCWKTGRF